MDVIYTICLTCHNGEQMTQLGCNIHLCIKLHHVCGHVVDITAYSHSIPNLDLFRYHYSIYSLSPSRVLCCLHINILCKIRIHHRSRSYVLVSWRLHFLYTLLYAVQFSMSLGSHLRFPPVSTDSCTRVHPIIN